MAFSEVPVCHQCVPLVHCPLKHHGVDAPGKFASERFQGSYYNLRFVLPIVGMKMRWVVVIVVHPDEDAVEFADSGHDWPLCESLQAWLMTALVEAM